MDGSSGSPDSRLHGVVSRGSRTRLSYMCRDRRCHLRPLRISSNRRSDPEIHSGAWSTHDSGSTWMRRNRVKDLSNSTGSPIESKEGCQTRFGEDDIDTESTRWRQTAVAQGLSHLRASPPVTLRRTTLRRTPQ